MENDEVATAPGSVPFGFRTENSQYLLAQIV